MKILRTIILDPLPRKVKISDKRRKTYWKKKDKLTKTLEDRLKRKLIYLDSTGYYRESIGNARILKNTKSHGTEKFISINAQHIYNSNMSHINRWNYIKKIKEAIKPFLVNVKPIDGSEFPVKLSGRLYCPIGKSDWDLDNLTFIYSKVIQDLLTELKIIPDDSIRYINKSLDLEHYETDTEDNQKLEIIIWTV